MQSEAMPSYKVDAVSMSFRDVERDMDVLEQRMEKRDREFVTGSGAWLERFRRVSGEGIAPRRA